MQQLPSQTRAVLFDIDGTLVDSNYAHVAAWVKAFVKVGHPVDAWRIHRGIGMDGSKLLDELLADDVESLGDAAKAAHTKYYWKAASDLRPLTGARELVAEVGRRGLTVVLATSAPEDELKILRSVLEIEDDVEAVTSAEDVEEAKPAPDIVHIALTKAGCEPGQALFVGDSVWDVKAALAAGVRCVALLSGGTGAQDLMDAGASAVYEDAAALMAHLDTVLG